MFVAAVVGLLLSIGDITQRTTLFCTGLVRLATILALLLMFVAAVVGLLLSIGDITQRTTLFCTGSVHSGNRTSCLSALASQRHAW